MCGFLLVVFSLISASAAMSQCFPPNWVHADKVKVSCNGTQIAQYCDPDPSCRNMSKPGVSLEKGSDEVCLTITNCSYHSSSCGAQSYINGNEDTTNFTANVPCYPARDQITWWITLELISGAIILHRIIGSVEAAWVQIIGLIILGLIIVGLIIGAIIYYKKLKCFRKAIRDFFCHLPCMNRAPEEKQDIEQGEKFLESLNHSAK